MDQALALDIVRAVEKQGIPCVHLGGGRFRVGEEKHLTPVEVTVEVPSVVERHLHDVRSYFIKDTARHLAESYGQ